MDARSKDTRARIGLEALENTCFNKTVDLKVDISYLQDVEELGGYLSKVCQAFQTKYGVSVNEASSNFDDTIGMP